MTSELAPRHGDASDGVAVPPVSETPAARARTRGQGRGRAKPDRPTAPPDPEKQGRAIILDALTGAARSRHELAVKLAKKEIPDDVAARLLDRFTEVGLVDDEAFARLWVEHRQSGKGLARRALAHELRHKGIDDELAREVLDDLDPADERDAAVALVRRKLRSLDRFDDATATRRLVAMLARKGYGAGVAYAVVRDELAASGRHSPDGDA